MAAIVPWQKDIIDAAGASVGNQAIIDIGHIKSGTFRHSNGGTTPGDEEFRTIKGGTLVVQENTGGYWRPLAVAAVDTLQGPANVFTFPAPADVANFYPGDVVDAVDLSGGVDLATGVNVTAVDKGAGTVTIDGAAITMDVGDYLILSDIDSDSPTGVLVDSLYFGADVDDAGVMVYVDAGGRALDAGGTVDKAKLIGATADALALLSPSIGIVTQDA